MKSWLKNKRFYIILVVVLIVVWVGYGRYKKANQPPEYDTAKVTRGDLKQTVEATGNIESLSDLALRFETPGTLERVNVTEGDKVTTGTILATLRLSDLKASVAAAEANLNQKLAGATDQDIQYYRAAADSAKASWQQSKADAEAAVKTAEASVATAQNNLKLAVGGEDSRIVGAAYEATVAVLQTILTKLDDGLTQADNILGVDNPQANDSFRSSLSILDPSQLNFASSYYGTARQKILSTHDAVRPLTSGSSHAAVDSALVLAEDALSATNQLLSSVSAVLKATPASSVLPQATLDIKKTAVETSRAAINAQYTAVIAQKQAIDDAKNSLSTYKIAYDQAVQDLADAKSNAVTSVQIKEASYRQAQASLDAKLTPPREVDVAYYRAALAQAIANRDKAILKAPQSGVVTKVNKKPGESVALIDVAINMLSPHYEIKVDIPETDISKLNLDQKVVITLDAFGDETKFGGSVSAIDPASTVVQDVVYYRVTVKLDDTDKPIKPGMTANVVVESASRQGVLYIPIRAVKTNADDTKFVKILSGNKVTEQTVRVGLRADNGLAEILSGLNEGQEVVISVKGQ